MGFSKNWKALGMVVMVVFPYFTVTVSGSEGNLSARYSPVLQVISVPKCSLPRQGHRLNTGWLEEQKGGWGVAQGHCAAEANMAAV